MILGIGTDITPIERIADCIQRYGQRFKDRCFTRGEQAYCDPRKTAAASYAGRFCCKEACAKALGTGIYRGVYWKDLEIVREAGAPYMVLHGRAREIADRMGVKRIHVSISHDHGIAVGFVVLEGSDGD